MTDLPKGPSSPSPIPASPFPIKTVSRVVEEAFPLRSNYNNIALRTRCRNVVWALYRCIYLSEVMWNKTPLGYLRLSHDISGPELNPYMPTAAAFYPSLRHEST